MTKKQKAKLNKALLVAVTVFCLALLVIPQLSVVATAPAWWIKTHNFFSNLGLNFKEYWMLWILVLILIFGVIK